MTLALVLIGGAAGAVLRYLTDRAIQSRVDAVFPWGTLTVNIVGSFVLGLLSGLGAGTGGLPGWVHALAGAGFCGALTTYSTFGLETVRLTGAGAWRHASINVMATFGAGIGACWLGWLLSS